MDTINFQIRICGFGFEAPDLDLIIFKRGGFGFERFGKGGFGFGFEGSTGFGFGFGFEVAWICPPLLVRAHNLIIITQRKCSDFVSEKCIYLIKKTL